ncbi:hypothetical protein BKA70DRAFT_1119033, partial [Coprinopsis sp. MPI-PUGE-AT-0042]
AGRTGHPACVICLGCHTHNVRECKATTTWDGRYPTASRRTSEGKVYLLTGGEPLCFDWQRGMCTSKKHDTRHFCSGCASPTHGAYSCPRAEETRA